MDAVAEQRRDLSALGRADVVRRFDRAVAALDTYLRELALFDLGALRGAPSSPNVLREVRTPNGDAAVLKLIGRLESAEAATMAAWNRNEVPAPDLLDAGAGDYADEVSHLLMGKVSGHPVDHAAMPALTGRAAELFRQAHISPPSGVLPLADQLRERLDKTTESWLSAGIELPADLHAVVDAVAGGSVLLHGDAAGHNLLVYGDRITLIDPAGVHGPAEFDAARWVGRAAVTTGPTGIGPMSDRALRSDRTLNSDAFEALLGLELAIEVGYRLDSKANVVALGADPQTFHDDTHQFIRLARSRLR